MDLTAGHGKVVHLQTRDATSEVPLVPRLPTNNSRVISGQAAWELAQHALRDWQAVPPQRRQPGHVVVSGSDEVPAVALHAAARHGFDALTGAGHEADEQLVCAGHPKVHAPAAGVEVEDRPRPLRIHPGDDSHREPGV